MKHFAVTLTLILLGQLALANQNPGPGQGFIDVPGGPVWYKIVGTGSTGFNQVPWTPPVDLANGTYLYTVELGLETGGSVESKSTIQVMK